MKGVVLTIITILISGLMLTSCGGRISLTSTIEIGFVPADSLIVKIDMYVGKKIETEGMIAHVCGVDGRKMKLMSNNGEVVNVILHDTTRFDRSLTRQRVKVYGLVIEERLGKQYIVEKEEEKALLCHVDQRPCRDVNWANRQIEAGRADSLSKRDIDRLRQMMKRHGTEYVSVVSIVCESHEVVETNN